MMYNMSHINSTNSGSLYSVYALHFEFYLKSVTLAYFDFVTRDMDEVLTLEKVARRVVFRYKGSMTGPQVPG
jgi:hypothetical protein